MDYIYIVVISDRHEDIRTIPFKNKSDAIEYAKKTAKEYCRHPEYLKESIIDDFIYYIGYSCEGDYICVVKEKMN